MMRRWRNRFVSRMQVDHPVLSAKLVGVVMRASKSKKPKAVAPASPRRFPKRTSGIEAANFAARVP